MRCQYLALLNAATKESNVTVDVRPPSHWLTRGAWANGRRRYIGPKFGFPSEAWLFQSQGLTAAAAAVRPFVRPSVEGKENKLVHPLPCLSTSSSQVQLGKDEADHPHAS